MAPRRRTTPAARPQHAPDALDAASNLGDLAPDRPVPRRRGAAGHRRGDAHRPLPAGRRGAQSVRLGVPATGLRPGRLAAAAPPHRGRRPRRAGTGDGYRLGRHGPRRRARLPRRAGAHPPHLGPRHGAEPAGRRRGVALGQALAGPTADLVSPVGAFVVLAGIVRPASCCSSTRPSAACSTRSPPAAATLAGATAGPDARARPRHGAPGRPVARRGDRCGRGAARTAPTADAASDDGAAEPEAPEPAAPVLQPRARSARRCGPARRVAGATAPVAVAAAGRVRHR